MKRSGKKPKNQPLPKLAYEDPQFMESLGARPLRILAEYLDPPSRLRRANIGDTIVMFGSARIQSRDRALAHLKRTQAGARGRRTPAARAKITGARSLLGMAGLFAEWRGHPRRRTSWAMTLGNQPRRF